MAAQQRLEVVLGDGARQPEFGGLVSPPHARDLARRLG
jgi:hypothetical protein